MSIQPSTKRRSWDSNPGNPDGLTGFQDRRNRPLCHSSGEYPKGYFLWEIQSNHQKIPVFRSARQHRSFLCCDFPNSSEFRREVTHEVTQELRRLSRCFCHPFRLPSQLGQQGQTNRAGHRERLSHCHAERACSGPSSTRWCHAGPRSEPSSDEHRRPQGC
jgi:hypothetical protein